MPVAVLLPPARRRSEGRLPDLDDQHDVDHRGLSERTARILLDTYVFWPGGLVADLDPSDEIEYAAVDLGLRLITPATPSPPRRLARLILDRLPRPQITGEHEMTEWIRARRSTLRQGGYLIIAVTRRPEPGEPYADHHSAITAAARTAGMKYKQHIITVHRPLAEPHPNTAAEDAALSDYCHQPLTTHSDLMVFQWGTPARGWVCRNA
ncbi:MAG: hypothetical protein ACRDT4_18700 [Micromonosporaceae bacterium]